MLDAKGGQGLNSMSKTVIGLHLAANQAGVAVDSQAMSKVNHQLILVSEPPADSEFLSFFVLYSRLLADFLSHWENGLN